MSELTQTAEIKKAETDKAKPYWNPYLSGIGLGLVLLLAFIVMGRGLGASGAFGSVIASGLNAVAPQHVNSNEYLKENFEGGVNPLKDWLVFEVIGVIAGGFISGALAGRIKITTFKGPNISNGKRLVFALLGGAIMGFGAKLARGCTSGQALTGGALLNLGSWVFMLCVFAGAYALAYFMRRQWT
ncbi:MAG: YeeE/YedE family protein [Ignavibacteriae bacterium]|nr:YeeE/YedE family protein [Ignavibacteriota bacterium]